MEKNHIFICQVFPLELTVVGLAKSFLKNKLTEWLGHKINEELEEGKGLEDIDVKLTASEFRRLVLS